MPNSRRPGGDYKATQFEGVSSLIQGMVSIRMHFFFEFKTLVHFFRI